MSDRLHFKIGDHHEPFEYESNTFDGCFSFQAVWPFFKKEELDLPVLTPGHMKRESVPLPDSLMP